MLPGAARPAIGDLRTSALDVLALADRTPPPPRVDLAHLPWDQRHAPGARWRIGIHELSSDEREQLERRTAPFWGELLAAHLVDQVHLFSSVMTKEAGDQSELPLHQDPTYVDEPAWRSLTLWVALEEISREADNGPLHVLPGSHLVGNGLRGTRLHPEYLHDQGRLWPLAVPVDVAAGDVVVIDSRLVHGSPPNRSARERHVLVSVVVPRDARLLHVVGDEGGVHADVLAVEPSFYRVESPLSLVQQPPQDLPLLRRVRRADHRTTTDDLVRAAATRA